MNDRFKFRAWDKSFCRMIYNIFFFWKENTITVYELHKDANKSYLPNSHIVLEQCTGLKDKNGKLIYEGDIVESYGELWKCVFEMNHGYGIDSPGFVLKNNFGHAQPFRNMQVVGNIHENPELLEVEK